jgi:hypothetical protein
VTIGNKLQLDQILGTQSPSLNEVTLKLPGESSLKQTANSKTQSSTHNWAHLGILLGMGHDATRTSYHLDIHIAQCVESDLPVDSRIRFHTKGHKVLCVYSSLS